MQADYQRDERLVNCQIFYISLFACESVHQGLDSERFSDESQGRREIFRCLAAPFDDSGIDGGTKISIKSTFMEIVFCLCIQQK